MMFNLYYNNSQNNECEDKFPNSLNFTCTVYTKFGCPNISKLVNLKMYKSSIWENRPQRSAYFKLASVKNDTRTGKAYPH